MKSSHCRHWRQAMSASKVKTSNYAAGARHLGVSSAARNRRGCKGRCACIHNNLPRRDRSHAPAWECSSRRSCASFRRGLLGNASPNPSKSCPVCHLDQRERSPISRDFSSRCSSKKQTREAFAPKSTASARHLGVSSAARNRRGCKGRCACIHNNLPRCDRSHAPAWECSSRRSSASFRRGLRWDASPNWRGDIPILCLPAGGAFFSLLAQRKETKERAALPLRRPRSPRCGTGGAKNSLRSNSLPLHPVPRLAERLSANGPPSCPNYPRRNKPQPGGAQVRGHREWVDNFDHSRRSCAHIPTRVAGERIPKPIEKLPCLSSRPEGEISNIPRFLLAMLVEKTDPGGVCSKILSKRPPLGRFERGEKSPGLQRKVRLHSQQLTQV